MKYIGFILHAYQPPWQFSRTIEKIVKECYSPLFESFVRSEARFTVNINFSLLEQLQKLGYQDLLEKIKLAVKLNQIELTGSAAYHPILPLIPKTEIERQIWLNEQGINRILNTNCGKGFFPPELAVSENIVPLIKEKYSWLITDDLPFNLVHGYVPYNFIPAIQGLRVFLRSSLWSNKVALEKIGDRKATAEEITSWLSSGLETWFGGEDGYVILATDIETFGHHIPEYRNFLEDFLKSVNQCKKMKLIKVSELMNIFPLKEIYIPSGSWATSPHDFWKKDFYPLWKSKTNKAQQLLWELLELGLSSLNKNNSVTRDMMDRCLNSCQFWWLSPSHYNSRLGLINVPDILEIIKQDSPRRLGKAENIAKKLREITRAK